MSTKPIKLAPGIVSRRQFLRAAAGAAGVAIGAGYWMPTPALAGGTVLPRPIRANRQVVVGVETFTIHHFAPESRAEPSKVGDFHGLAANCRNPAKGAGPDTDTRHQTPLHDH